MGMLSYNTMGMGLEWEYGHGNGIKKFIPAHLYFKAYLQEEPVFLHGGVDILVHVEAVISVKVVVSIEDIVGL